MKRSARFRSFIFPLALCLMVLAAYPLITAVWERHLVDRSLDRVAVVVDGREIAQLPIEGAHIYSRLRELGVTGISLYEYTLQDALDRGDIFLATKGALKAVRAPLAAHLPPSAGDDDLFLGWSASAASPEGGLGALSPQLVARLIEKLDQEGRPVPMPDAAGSHAPWRVWQIEQGSAGHWLRTSLGFHEGDLAAINEAGLALIPRLAAGREPSILDPNAALSHLSIFFGKDAPSSGASPLTLGPLLFSGTNVAHDVWGTELVERLRGLAVPIGLIEFAPQEGLEQVARRLQWEAVRVHSITDREMAAQMTVEKALDRWMRAVRERSVRVLYVRLFPAHDEEEPGLHIERNLLYVEALIARLKEAGYEIGLPDSMPRQGAHPAALAVAVALTGAAAGWLATMLFGTWPPLQARSEEGQAGTGRWTAGLRPTGRRTEQQRTGQQRTGQQRTEREPTARQLTGLQRTGCPRVGSGAVTLWMCTAGAVLVSAAFWLMWLKGYTILARQGVAFAAAVTFSMVGLSRAWLRYGGLSQGIPPATGGVDGASAPPSTADTGSAPAPPGSGHTLIPLGSDRPARPLLSATLSMLEIVAVSLLGSTLLVVLLFEPRFLLKLEEFRGVKAAHALPLALSLMVWLKASGFANGTVSSWKEGLRRLLRVRFTVAQAIVAAAALGMAGIYLLRTGNDGFPVPAIEAAFRRLLEEGFWVRPRTKEILIGHPALFLALYFGAVLASGSAESARRRWMRPMTLALLVAGSIGQASILNTFAHAHTPVAISAARTALGLLLGLGVGGLLLAVGVGLTRRWHGPQARAGASRHVGGPF